MIDISYKQWIEETGLFGHTRSSQLKTLDAAILAYTKAKSSATILEVAKAFELWSASHHTNAPSSRDRKAGAISKLETGLRLINQIRKEAPQFTWDQSALRRVLSALFTSSEHAPAVLQDALDQLSYHDAKQNSKVLQLIVNARPRNCYIHVKNFEYRSTAPQDKPSIVSASEERQKKVQYTSAMFTVEAKIFSISPANAFHQVGFIQHCTAKSDISSFISGQQVEDAHQGGFPVADAPNDPSQHPWYCKGRSRHCTYPSWINLRSLPAEKSQLEMNDQFMENIHPFYAISPGTHDSKSMIRNITRKQSFICYLVHKRSDASERVFKSVSYTIDVSLEITHKMTSFSSSKPSIGKFDTKVIDISESTHVPGFRLPAVTGPKMNGKSQWQYRKNSTAGWAVVNW